MNKSQDIIETLKEYKQDHIISLLNKSDEDKKQEIIDQLNHIDLHQLMELYDNTKKQIEVKNNKIEAISYHDKEKIEKKQKEKWDEIGKKIIQNGEYAVITMAGGQGTRLGHPGPKGTFLLDIKQFNSSSNLSDNAYKLSLLISYTHKVLSILDDNKKLDLFGSYNISVISSDCSLNIFIGDFCLLSKRVNLPLKSPAEKIFSDMNFTFENLSEFELVYFSSTELFFK